jgi:hypothetical protein
MFLWWLAAGVLGTLALLACLLFYTYVGEKLRTHARLTARERYRRRRRGETRRSLNSEYENPN